MEENRIQNSDRQQLYRKNKFRLSKTDVNFSQSIIKFLEIYTIRHYYHDY